MVVCRICSENKTEEEFKTIPLFTKHKKHIVTWCQTCQKMYMEMRKDRFKEKKRQEDECKFIVSFD